MAFLLGFGGAAHAFAGLNAINIAVKWDSIKSSAASEINDQIVSGELPAPTDSGVSFDFINSQPRTDANLRNFVQRTPDPGARADLKNLIASQPNLMSVIGDGVRAYGFDPHNVADAYAVWWINVWGASQKINVEPDAATVAAVKQQVRSAFAATPAFADTSDAERQEYAEALLLQAGMLGSAFEQMKNDPKMLDQLAGAARNGAKASGLDLSLMTLTANGFVPRKGADASEAAGDATIQPAAAAAPAPSGGTGDSGNMGLALAAGAGFGVVVLGALAYRRLG